MGWDAVSDLSDWIGNKFQSTHPVWGGTRPKQIVIRVSEISIHPPRVGWDVVSKL